MAFTTYVLCDHPDCDVIKDIGFQMEPDLIEGWASFYFGPTLEQRHLCTYHLTRAGLALEGV